MHKAISTPGIFIWWRYKLEWMSVIFVSLPHSNMDVELEIKDPDLLVVPSFCVGQPLEETPEGTVNSFANEFM